MVPLSTNLCTACKTVVVTLILHGRKLRLNEVFLFSFSFLAAPHGLKDLSSLTRDPTHTLSSGSMES